MIYTVIYTDRRCEEVTFEEMDDAIGFLIEAGYEDETLAIIGYNPEDARGTQHYDKACLQSCFEDYRQQGADDLRHDRSLGVAA